MLLYQENFTALGLPAQSGKLIAQVSCAGVVTCSGCTVEAHWVSAPKTVWFDYVDATELRLDCGLPVNNDLTVNQLKAICTQLGLSTSGLKADLLARVQEATS